MPIAGFFIVAAKWIFGLLTGVISCLFKIARPFAHAQGNDGETMEGISLREPLGPA